MTAPTLHESLTLLDRAMAAAGIPYAGKHSLKTDGTVNRWHEDGKGNGPRWCFAHILSSGHVAASFGDWRTGQSHHFRSWEGNGIDHAEVQRLTDEWERRQSAAEENAAKTHAASVKQALAQWELMPETGNSAYLERKQVQVFGIRYGADHYGPFVAVPMRLVSGEFRGYQRIYVDGQKRYAAGCSQKKAYHLIGQLEPGGILYLVEGYATGVSVHQATGRPVVVCFDAYNLKAVADALKSIYPELQIVVAADNDQWKKDKPDSNGKPLGNTGVKSAYAVAYAYPGTKVAIPNFENLDTSDKPTDFNDLARLAGLENVTRQLGKAFEPKPRDDGEDKTRPDQDQAASRRYSLQFAVAGQQPQSAVAAILSEHNSGLAYDHVAQKWLLYINTQWKEITDTAAFKIVTDWINAGLDGEGYTISFINGIVSFLKACLATDGFDDNANLVPFRNGVLELSTMNLLPHSPDLKIAWCLPFDYDPAATCQPVIDWLMECVAGDPLQVELLRAYIKAILTGRSDLQRYIELIGAAGSGKGSFIRLCTKLVGNRNVHVTELKRLENNRFEPARLYRKRLCIITDAERYTGDVSMLKAMTGEDDLPFEEKHKQGGENFKFRGMVLIAANQEIASSDLTGGLQRRRITVRFDNRVDPANRRDLEREFEPYLPGVIAWALSLDDTRMKELIVETDSHVPTVSGFNLQTLKRVNPLAAWADDCLILDSQAETPVGSCRQFTQTEKRDIGYTETRTVIEHTDDWLYPNYVEWCAGKGNRAVSSVNFTGLLKDLLCHQLKLEGIEKLERAGTRLSRFKGIRLRTDVDQDIGNFLFGTDSVRVRYGLGTGCIEQSTGSTDKSKFTNETHSHVENQTADCKNENASTADMQKNSELPVLPVLPVPNQQNQEVTEDYPVPDPYLTRTGLTDPPDYEPDYMDSLIESFQAGSTALPITETAGEGEDGENGEFPGRHFANAKNIIDPPAAVKPECRHCGRFAPLASHCHAMQCHADPFLPPACGGRHFQPKVVQS